MSLEYGSPFYNIIKSLHIIFMVSYFAGIFYMVRLFIYHSETPLEKEPKKSILQQQFIKMERLLWNIITVPAFILMTLTGFIMLLSNWSLYFLFAPWMHFKLVFIAALFIYQFLCWRILLQLKHNIFKYTSLQLRLWNEIATIILFGVVFIVIMKGQFASHRYWIIGGLCIFAILIMLIVRIVKRIRK